MQLIERYYDPISGVVEFEGRDLKDINIGYLRDCCGLVSQEPTLFNTTIAENIKYGKPDATDEEMYEAAKKANAVSRFQVTMNQFDSFIFTQNEFVSSYISARLH